MRLSNQFSISEVLGVHNTLERVYEDVRVIPVVKTPFKLFYVLVHMLDRHLVEGSDDGTLEQAPHSLNAVSVNIPSHPLLFGVVYRLMSRIAVLNAEVGFPFIRINSFCLVPDSSLDKSMKRLPSSVGDPFNADFPASLDSSGNPSLVALIGTAFALGFTPNERFIHFYDSDKRRTLKRFVTHSLTNTMAEIPSRLVGDSQGALHLVGRDSLLGFTHQVDGNKPLAERKVGIVHNGSAHYRELVSTALTFPAIMLWNLECLNATATRTVNAVRPAYVLKHLATVIICLKFIHQRHEVNHDSKPS